jgi:hypothetical protein
MDFQVDERVSKGSSSSEAQHPFYFFFSYNVEGQSRASQSFRLYLVSLLDSLSATHPSRSTDA